MLILKVHNYLESNESKNIDFSKVLQMYSSIRDIMYSLEQNERCRVTISTGKLIYYYILLNEYINWFRYSIILWLMVCHMLKEG